MWRTVPDRQVVWGNVQWMKMSVNLDGAATYKGLPDFKAHGRMRTNEGAVMFVFVEDNGMDLAMAVSSLSRMGARNSSVFAGATRAIEYLRNVENGTATEPEAIILDLLLRQGAGQDVLSFVKSREALRHIPVLVWTVVESETQHRICLAMGAREVLVKSRRAEELKDAILRLRSAA